MVGVVVTVSVGAAAGAFILVGGPPPIAPQAVFAYDFTNDGSTDSLVIRHEQGDQISGDRLLIEITGAAPTTADGSYQWNGSAWGINPTLDSGASVTLDPSTIGDGSSLDLDQATVSLVWESKKKEHSTTIDLWKGPDSPAVISTSTPTPTSTPDLSDPGHAYVDVNANGEWDDGTDTKIDNADITDGVYDAGGDALVIPDSVGSISSDKIDFDGAAVTIAVDLTGTGDHDVTVTAESGQLTIEGVSVDSASGRQVVLRGEAGVRANGTTIDSGVAITVKSNSGAVYLSGASIVSTETSGENAQLTSRGDLDLRSATIVTTAGGEAGASLQVVDATLFVDGAEIDDGDDTLVYSPSGITVDGTPTSGSVTSS